MALVFHLCYNHKEVLMLLVADTVGVLSREADKHPSQPFTSYCKQHLGTSDVFVILRPIPLGLKI